MASSKACASKEKSEQIYGGYDYTFVGTIPSEYICSICLKVLCDAHLTDCCGQHFCASCLTRWLGTQQRRKTCPHCRQEDFQHVPNKAIYYKVNELKIHCTNHREGCGWVGELGGLKSHLDSDEGCGYVEVACTNRGCWERVSRKDLQLHLQKRCYYRTYVCKHCGHKDAYRAITGKTYWKCGGHYSECPEYPLACPNKCGVSGIRRRAMPDHRSSCPLEPLDCPFKDAGCTEKIARKNMEDHMTANQQKHLLQGYQELKLLKWSIKREIDSLEESIRCKMNTPESTAQSLSHMKSILKASLDEVGDKLIFRVTDFTQLRKEKKAWHSPPFSIGGKIRVRLAVHPSTVGRGQGSHVSVSLILTEFVQNEEDMTLEYNMSVAAIGEHRSAMPIILKLCTYERFLSSCSAYFPFPSPGEVLQSGELFLKREDATSLLMNDSMILELKLLKHHHRH